jgi:hypothetical protein
MLQLSGWNFTQVKRFAVCCHHHHRRHPPPPPPRPLLLLLRDDRFAKTKLQLNAEAAAANACNLTAAMPDKRTRPIVKQEPGSDGAQEMLPPPQRGGDRGET